MGMGVLSNKIQRDDLKPGDHIYSYRHAYIYSHHGVILVIGDCNEFAVEQFAVEQFVSDIGICRDVKKVPVERPRLPSVP